MAVQGQITFNRKDGRASENVRFAISDADEAIFRSYLREAHALEDGMNRQGGFAASYSVSWKAGEELVISGNEPTDDQRAVVLHRLRPFLLQNETLHFHVVRGIVARSSDAPFLQEWVRHTKERFTGKKLQQQFVISIGDMVVNSESTLERWLNGFEYHRDDDKALELIKAHDPIPVDSSRPILIMLLQEKVSAVLHLGHVIDKMLNRRTEG